MSAPPSWACSARGRAPIIVGHRGGRGEGWPLENSIAAFERARDEGAFAIETDLRLAADAVVAFHDPTLRRVTHERDTRAIAEVPSGELAPLGVPRLADVLAWAAAAGMALNLELKHDVPDRRALVRAVVRELRGASAAVLASSFDPWILLLLRARAVALPCSLLTDPGQSYARALHELARPPLVFGLHVERRQADRERVARWKKRGLAVGVWTVNDPEEARGLASAGVDILITDQPGAIRRALR